MSNSIFQLDDKGLRELKQFLKKAHKQFFHAQAGVLNEQAFQARTLYLKKIESDLTIRNKRFVKSSMIYQKATASKPFSIAGSIYGKRFSGWKEQQFGGRGDLDHAVRSAARGGSYDKSMKSKSRLHEHKTFRKWTDYAGKRGRRYRHSTKGQAMTAMLHDARFKGQNEPFIMDKGFQATKSPSRKSSSIRGNGLRSYKHGLYVRGKGKRMQILQHFDDKPKMPKKTNWMTFANRQLTSQFELEKSWRENLRRQSKFIK